MSAADVIDEISKKADEESNLDHIRFIEWSREIIDYGQVILGLLVILVFILVPIVISLELVYINIPITRKVFDNIRGGNRRVSRVAEFSLRDAVEAVEKAALGEYGSNPNMAYLIIKAKSSMTIGVMLALVLQGTSMLMGIANGLVGVAVDYILNLL